MPIVLDPARPEELSQSKSVMADCLRAASTIILKTHSSARSSALKQSEARACYNSFFPRLEQGCLVSHERRTVTTIFANLARHLRSKLADTTCETKLENKSPFISALRLQRHRQDPSVHRLQGPRQSRGRRTTMTRTARHALLQRLHRGPFHVGQRSGE